MRTTSRSDTRQRRLHLVCSRPRSPLAELVDRIEEAYSRQHGVLIRQLTELDEALEGLNVESRREIGEQIAFIRVGLRCLADAIGELEAHAAAIDPVRRIPGGAAPEGRPA